MSSGVSAGLFSAAPRIRGTALAAGGGVSRLLCTPAMVAAVETGPRIGVQDHRAVATAPGS